MYELQPILRKKTGGKLIHTHILWSTNTKKKQQIQVSKSIIIYVYPLINDDVLKIKILFCFITLFWLNIQCCQFLPSNISYVKWNENKKTALPGKPYDPDWTTVSTAVGDRHLREYVNSTFYYFVKLLIKCNLKFLLEKIE